MENVKEDNLNKENIINNPEKILRTSSIFDMNKYHINVQDSQKKEFFLQELYINDSVKNKKEFKYKNNKINTTKYNIFTFIPKGVLYQFLKLNNFYFLTIAALQLTTLSPISPLTTAAFAFVIVLSLVREGLEDIPRHKYDKSVNGEKCTMYKNKKWTEVLSQELNMGDIVLVKNGHSFTSDLLLLDSNLKDGICYIETSNLDGERNSKLKISNPKTDGIFKKFAHKENFEEKFGDNYFKNDKNNEEQILCLNQDKSHVEKINENYYQMEFIEEFDISGIASCNKPNPNLYELTGFLNLKYKRPEFAKEKDIVCDIDKNQLLLKGSILRNCKWVIGIVIYSGMNSKIMLNSNKPTIKFSKIDNILAKLLILIFFIQLIFCCVSAGLNSYFYNEIILTQNHIPQSKNPALDSFLVYFTYMVLLNTMIPISLIITIELVKLTQSIFIKSDVDMYSYLREKFATTGTVSLIDELGMVNYIFSDKTGTLTLNKMDFKYCVIGNSCFKYYKENDEKNNEKRELKENNDLESSLIIEEKLMKSKTNKFGKNFFSNFNKIEPANDKIYKDYKIFSKSSSNVSIDLETQAALAHEFWKGLAFCHECIVNENNEVVGASQDDIELVKTAISQGYILKPSEDVKQIKLEINNEEKIFQVIKLIEFSSSRKRASILIKDDKYYKLFTKGADSEILSRLSESSRKDFRDTSTAYVDYFSTLGYRTLLVGMKILNEEEVQKFQIKMKEADKLTSKGKDKFFEEYFDRFERNFDLIGAVVQEDKLQNNVPSTIRDMRLANIKVWMLTGDKIETAISIGKSCQLIPAGAEKCFYVILNKENFIMEMEKLAKDHNEKIKFGSIDPPIQNEFYLAINGDAITEILSDPDLTDTFEYVSKNAAAVVCARFSPKQKADVVKKMKQIHPNKIMLSIGDGGNDVSMILEAHIGIGVYGEEGSQAIQASDFAIGEFKMLRFLLFGHGRINHMRISQMILYFLYKNFFFTIIQFYFGFYNNFSGQPALDEWYITLYNIFFTAFPLVTRALFDHDVKIDDGTIVDKMLPFLYEENREYPQFTTMKLLLSVFRGFSYGIFMYYFTLATILPDAIDSSGNVADHFTTSSIMYASIFHGVSMRILILIRYFTIYTLLVFVFFSYGLYIMYICFMDNIKGFKSVGSVLATFSSGRAYLNIIFVIVVVSLCDFLTKSIEFNFNKNISNTLSKLRSLFGNLQDEKKMPKKICDYLDIYKMIESRILQENKNNLGVKQSEEEKEEAVLFSERDQIMVPLQENKEINLKNEEDKENFDEYNNKVNGLKVSNLIQNNFDPLVVIHKAQQEEDRKGYTKIEERI